MTETQGLATVDPNKATPLEVNDPITSEKPLNQPLDLGGVTDSRKVARQTSADAEKQTSGLVDKASASGPKLVKDSDEKGPDGLTEEDRQKVEELKRRDLEVRAHEQAHAAAGGPYAGAPRFRFVRGPDGKFYAVPVKSLSTRRLFRQPTGHNSKDATGQTCCLGTAGTFGAGPSCCCRSGTQDLASSPGNP